MQYPRLSSVDMRYERQVVLEMQPGAAPATQTTDSGKAAAPAPVVSAPVVKTPAPLAKAPAPVPAPAPKKPAVKPVAKAPAKKKPAPAAKSTAAHAAPTKSASAPQQPAKVSNESFWVHPPKKGVAAPTEGSGTDVKYHPPQVVHP
jgi:cell division protein FtsQ